MPVILAVSEKPLQNEVEMPLCQVPQTVMHHEMIHQVIFEVKYLLELEGVGALLADFKPNHLFSGCV